ncbi:MAG: hypothetical protein J6C53_00565 [Clostridia bacterium]|nr:hypothetical protein [Clostridia bacterium]
MKDKNQKIVEEVMADFKNRAQARKAYDLIWQVNMNFLMGNQYCSVGYGGKLEESDRQFFWQEREVFNHIAPVYDIRFAKLSKVKPGISILPATNDERDKQTAKVSKKIYNSVKSKLGLDDKINQGIKWAEVCGTVFYKVGWNPLQGQIVGMDEKGNPIRSGEVEVSVVSPFEIYPDSMVCEEISDCQSIIHAKAFTVAEIKSMYGIEVEGEKVNTYSLDSVDTAVGGLGFYGTTTKMFESVKEGSAVVVERYQKPTKQRPNGRLTIVAGNKLVYDGDIPYAVGGDCERDYPFIKQVSVPQAGCFWGTSVVERLVPVQRAYNAVKNRKHEFINRLSLGVLSVEDGSIDLDNLEDEGLCPGKVLVYRQGATEPKYLQGENLPNGIIAEEEMLLEEFSKISGINDLVGSDSISSRISGVALELMIGQDETRLNASVESIKWATLQMAQKILRMYKQYALIPRIARIIGENGEVEMFYFNSADITSEDIVIESQNDNLQSLAQRREMVMTLLDKGVLCDENGNLSGKMKGKIIEMLGIGNWESAQDVSELHIKKAGNENIKMFEGKSSKVSEIDNHELHINEHIAFMLGEDFEKSSQKMPKIEEIMLNHIKEHKKYLEVK